MKLVALLAALLTATLVGCTEEPEVDRTISRSELEAKVAEIYPPRNPRTEVTVACEGGLSGELNATQLCTVSVDKKRAQVRVVVAEVDGDDAVIDAVAFVPARRVAKELLAALAAEGYHVAKVTCPGELTGTVGSEVTCTVTPNNGKGDVVATVTAVRGLRIDFDYEVAS